MGLYTLIGDADDSSSGPCLPRSPHPHTARAHRQPAEHAWRAAGCPIYADPSPNTVKVRVAVSVSPDGKWAAHGGSHNPEGALDHCEHEDGDRASWITAHVPLPEPAAEIVGEVEGG